MVPVRLPLGRFPFVHTHSFEEALCIQARITGPLQATQLDRRRPFEWQANRTLVGSLNIMVGRYQAGVCAESPHAPDLYSFMVPLTSNARLEQRGQSANLAPGRSGALTSPGLPTKVILGNDFCGLNAAVRDTTFEAALQALMGAPCTAPLRFQAELDLRSGPAGGLARLLDYLVQEANHLEGALRSPLVAARMSEAFVYALLMGLPHNYASSLRAPTAAPRPRCVAHVEDYMAAHAHEHVAVADLVAVSGVSARSLFAAFRSHRGCSPMAFLRARRLERAHTQLSATPQRSVAEVALECGFEHLGRFSGAYRQRFGESPSETLRRARGSDARADLTRARI